LWLFILAPGSAVASRGGTASAQRVNLSLAENKIPSNTPQFAGARNFKTTTGRQRMTLEKHRIKFLPSPIASGEVILGIACDLIAVELEILGANSRVFWP
jgi:hypothetical protein